MKHLSSVIEKYVELTPRSREIWESAKQYLPGGDSRNSIFWDPYPIYIKSARGPIVTDVDDMQRVDFINTMTTMILGHAFSPVMDAVSNQLKNGVAYNAPNSHQIQLAKILCERVPSFDRVRFTNSGTEATMNTIRAARAFTGRTLFAKAEGGYHGTHDAVSVSVKVKVEHAGGSDSPVALPSTEGLPDEVLDQVIVFPFNDVEGARKILEQHKDQLAAVIIEPVLGSVGMVPATYEFLEMLRNFTWQHSIVLIFDEVISYRVTDGGSQKFFGVTPDMTSLGKIIGGGFPIGAFGGRKDIMDLYDPTGGLEMGTEPSVGPHVSHAGTFNANPVTMLAGSVTLDHLTDDIYESLAFNTEILRQGIRDVCAELEIPVQVTGIGSLFGIHFNDIPINNYRDIASSDTNIRRKVFLGLMNEGILIAPNLVGALSTEIGSNEIKMFVEKFKLVLSKSGI
jgi:glutamate-1-semialdehyde 2,1-aminomutase